MFTNLKEEQFFLSHIKNTDKVLEYGSGQSTIQISQLCAQIVSVEHQKKWYDYLTNQLPKNCISLYHPPNKNYIEGTHCGTLEEFFDYIHSPLNYAPFDIILIDGRARTSCASLCKQLVKTKDSLIFIHDWNRTEYHSALNDLELIESCDTMARFIIKNHD